jgi:hypothetical protein
VTTGTIATAGTVEETAKEMRRRKTAIFQKMVKTAEESAAEKNTAETAETAVPTAARTAVRTGMTSQDGRIPNKKTTLRNKNHDREPISASGRTDR